MLRKPIVGGNWKCNPSSKQSLTELNTAFSVIAPDIAGPSGRVEMVIFPSTIHVLACRAGLPEHVDIGVQNVSRTDCGAFTGEVTAGMARDVGCAWALVGHSERRHKYGETVDDTLAKVEQLQQSGLGVILCVGELLEERESCRTMEVCMSQLGPILPKVADFSRFVIAYEPVWAIGTGVVATREQAQEVHNEIRNEIQRLCGDGAANAVRIQYGGSVTPENCAGLMAQPDIDGFLVGGASLKPSFVKIVETAAGEC